jgi:hypothetical protein
MKLNSSLTQTVKILPNQTEEEMLNDREDDGRVFFETEQSNKSLP